MKKLSEITKDLEAKLYEIKDESITFYNIHDKEKKVSI